MSVRESILHFPLLYRAFATIVGRFGLSKMDLYAKHLPYTSGSKILDLGCGPATSTRYFRSDDYLGIDIDQSYINTAKRLFPRHKFKCIDFISLTRESDIVPEHGFDLILAYGLFHHLDDTLLINFLKKAHELLAHKGHLISFDGCIYDNQPRIKNTIVMADRGQYIRSPSHLKSLVESTNFDCIGKIEEKSLLIPYSLFTLSSKKN